VTVRHDSGHAPHHGQRLPGSASRPKPPSGSSTAFSAATRRTRGRSRAPPRPCESCAASPAFTANGVGRSPARRRSVFHVHPAALDLPPKRRSSHEINDPVGSGRYDRAVAAVRDACGAPAAASAVLLGFLILPSPAPQQFVCRRRSRRHLGLAGARSAITIKPGTARTLQSTPTMKPSKCCAVRQTFGTPQNPLSVSIPLANIMIRDPAGGSTPGTLAPEDFRTRRTFAPAYTIKCARDACRLAHHRDGARLDRHSRHRIRGGAGVISIDDYMAHAVRGSPAGTRRSPT